MINHNEVVELVRDYFPQAEKEVLDKIVLCVVREAEIMIYSLIRQIIAQEKGKLYRNGDDLS
jgi:hypothetical protein